MCTPHYSVSITVNQIYSSKSKQRTCIIYQMQRQAFRENTGAIISTNLQFKQAVNTQQIIRRDSLLTRAQKEAKICTKNKYAWQFLTLHKVACADLGTNQDVPRLPWNSHDSLSWGQWKICFYFGRKTLDSSLVIRQYFPCLIPYCNNWMENNKTNWSRKE